MSSRSGHFTSYPPAPKPLPRREQLALVVRAQAGDRAAREQLVDTTRSWVYREIMRLAPLVQGAWDDAVQDGMIGCDRAIDTFDVEKGSNFLTHASSWIKAKILYGAKHRNGAVQVPMSLWRRDAARANALAQRPLSTDAKMGTSGRTILDAIPDHRLRPDTMVEDADARAHAGRQIRKALAALPARSRDILERRWLADRREELGSVGKTYGLSRERIRQLEVQALGLLAAQLGGTIQAQEILWALSGRKRRDAA